MEALQEVGETGMSWSNDPCLDEDLMGLRGERRFRELSPGDSGRIAEGATTIA